MQMVDETKVICCNAVSDMNPLFTKGDDFNKLQLELNLTQQLLCEVREKNTILIENNSLLKEKIQTYGRKTDNGVIIVNGQNDQGQAGHGETRCPPAPAQARGTDGPGSIATLATNRTPNVASAPVVQATNRTHNAASAPVVQATRNTDSYATRAAPCLNVNTVNRNKHQTMKVDNKQILDERNVGLAIMQAQTTAKMTEIQQLCAQESHLRPKQQDGWQLQKRRSNRNVMVGDNREENSVQTVPKYISLHVTRLHPSTKTEDLQRMLSKHFPEVECAEHVSKFPQLYSSMKVTIKQQHFREAWKREVWPNGALVSRFFGNKRMPLQSRETGDPHRQ